MTYEHIMITCPNTQMPVKTGFRSLPGSSLDGLKNVKLKRCSACLEEHVWNGREAYWVEYVLQPSRRSGLRQLWQGLLHPKTQGSVGSARP